MIKDRQGQVVRELEGQNQLLKKLYSTSIGRCALKILVSPFVTHLGGLYMSSPFSKTSISSFIKNNDIDMSQYDEIILGFPIWWYVAPTIVNTFLEKYDFTGKKIVLFATSGGSGFGNTVSELKISAHDAVIVEGKVFHKAAKQEIAEWVRSIL